MTRAFSAGVSALHDPGALPQAKMNTAPFGAKHVRSMSAGRAGCLTSDTRFVAVPDHFATNCPRIHPR